MKVSELYKAVAQLGFEDSLDNDDRFLFAANRALFQVNALRPQTSAFTIHHAPLENEVNVDTFKPLVKTEDIYFYASNVKSYYFETTGNGVCYLERFDNTTGNWAIIKEISFKSDKDFIPHRGFIKNGDSFLISQEEVRLHFTGEYLYLIKNVAMYSHILSASTEDIPAYRVFEVYDISVLTSDFLSLASPPIQDDYTLHRLSSGFDVENGRVVLLPRNTPSGLYKVIYNRKPKSISLNITPSTGEETIDLDEDLCALLPPLIASYIWLDDEPAKAQYYLALYQDRAEDIRQHIFNATPVVIKNKNGW